MRSTWNQFRPKKFQVTGALGLVIALLVAFVLSWLPGVGDTFRSALMFDPTLGKAWTIFTYPLALPGEQFFFFLIMCWWLYQVGRMLEPSMGMWTYVASFAVFSLLGGIGVAIGDAATGVPRIASLGLPVAAMTVLWGARYQSEVVRLMLVIPIKGVWLAVITAALVFFGYGSGMVFFSDNVSFCSSIRWRNRLEHPASRERSDAVLEFISSQSPDVIVTLP